MVIRRYSRRIKYRAMELETEADLQVFGNTELQNFPLITVIGREPDNNTGRVHRIGRYADAALQNQPWPSVSFWDKTYGLLGRYSGLSAAELKQQCVYQECSPIVITDFSPVSLNDEFSSNQKRDIRWSIPATDIIEHLDQVLAHDAIFARSELTILSGLERCGFHPQSVRYIEERLDVSGVPWCHITSLSSRNTDHSVWHRELTPYETTITAVMNQFADLNNTFSKAA